MSEAALTELKAELRRLCRLEGAMGLQGWDEQVNLPSGAASQRAEEMAALASLIHRERTSSQLGKLIEAAEQEALDEAGQTVVREARRDFDRKSRLPADFIAKQSAARSHAYHAWVEARKADDFAAFQPHLEQQVELAREEAAYLDASDAYDYQIDLHDPGMTAGTIEALFDELQAGLVELVEGVISSGITVPEGLFRAFPIDRQEAFLREVVGALGFDWERGRLDVAVHPFCSGSGSDVRLTTRFDEDNPLDALFSSIHEAGHGLYEQGLPNAEAGTALAESVGMAVHESQSRLWENQVCRSRPFWQHYEPRLRAAFPEQLASVESDQLYLAINEVRRQPIRVDADELNYNLHIILRFRLERALFDNKLAVADLPEAWRALAKELLGLELDNNREGVLQDVHWSGGAFGYFPSYCLGNMLAAQLWYRLREALPELDEQLAKADFAPLLAWLRENVHQHGKRYDTLTLCRKATGSELSPQSLLRYLRERYGPLYGL